MPDPSARRRVSLPINGLLVIDKPAGWTSHDVVAKLRGLTDVRRIGHAGTLDPLATGVLPLGIGLGTRVLEYLSDADKTYEATILLGVATDTYDADGRVTASLDPSTVTRAAVEQTLAGFRGEIEQRPPAYSAIKQNGVPLYKLARAGQMVEPPLRRVTLYTIDVLAAALPSLQIRVHCSKGTYIRSLAHDLGQRLGIGAHLTALRRTATGGFTIAQALTLETWQAALADGAWPAHIWPLDAALGDLKAVVLTTDEATRLRDGVAPALTLPDAPPDMLVRAYDPAGVLLAIIRAPGTRDGWRAEKVFHGQAAAQQNDGGI